MLQRSLRRRLEGARWPRPSPGQQGRSWWVPLPVRGVAVSLTCLAFVWDLGCACWPAARARRNRHVDGSFIGVQSLSADDQGCTTLPHAQGTVIGAVFASFGVPGDLSLGSRQLAGRPRLHLLQPVTDAAAPVASIDAEPGPSNQDVLNAIEASQKQLSGEIQEGFAQWVNQRRLKPP